MRLSESQIEEFEEICQITSKIVEEMESKLEDIQNNPNSNLLAKFLESQTDKLASLKSQIDTFCFDL